jgi:hypothetical protein
MSSVSSLEGSDRDSLFHKNFSEASQAARHSYLRKTDLLDTLDTSRLRDTDTWSVAATIDDQESVISAHGGPPSIISSSRLTLDRETDDDRSTLDGESSIRDHLQDMHLNQGRLDTLRDLAEHNLLRSVDDEDDKRSRSNAAEFGDDGARSATADFDHSVTSDDEDRVNNNVMDDQISAPPQPQPSFASVTKSYAELMEENELLQSQLRNLQQTQKLQQDTILNLKNLTGCDEEVYVKALNLSHMNKPDELSSNSSENRNQSEQGSRNESMFFESSSALDNNQAAPIINARTLTHKLARLAEMITRFANAAVNDNHKYALEQSLYTHITDAFLNVLPFGTENQDLLNIAYSDQIRRFHSTLGSNFAKWYRKQTVQSLSLNPATKDYLEAMRSNLTNEMMQLLATMGNTDSMDDMRMWNDVLDLCAALSLEIHGGDTDVSAQPISVGSKYDEEVMAVIDDTDSHDSNIVKMVINPLFVDDEQVVLLPARVVLE